LALQQVLVYSDSLTWGIVRTIRRRLPFDARWPGAMEIALTQEFQSMHQYTAWHAAQGIATLVTAIRQAPIEPGMPIPASALDGIHLDADQHQTLGQALVRCVASLPGILSPAAT
jgi:lysophospholipase L1-like esterase